MSPKELTCPRRVDPDTGRPLVILADMADVFGGVSLEAIGQGTSYPIRALQLLVLADPDAQPLLKNGTQSQSDRPDER